jgi:hypothetical protein
MTVVPTPVRPHTAHSVLIAALLLLVGGALGAILATGVIDRASDTRVRGSGIAASQTREVPGFTSVDLAGSNVVTIRAGRKQSIVVHGDDNLIGRVTTRVRGGRLVIDTTPGSFSTQSPMWVDVHVPSLDSVLLSGSGVVSIKGLRAPHFAAMLTGSGVIHASGSVTQLLRVAVEGSGDAQLQPLVAQHVHAVISGSGRIIVTATKSLDAQVPGSGAIVYSGNPARVTTDVTGSGAVIQG